MTATPRHWAVCAALLAAIAAAPSLASAQANTVSTLSPVDYTFIGLTYLGNQFQVDSGKLGETRAADATLKAYAALMDTSHVAVEKRLVALLHKLGAVQPPASLLAGAYRSLTTMLAAEHGADFDRDYVRGQVDYQNANDALYRWEIENGSNAELKAYARETLPKIDDHKARILAMGSLAAQK